MIEQLTIVASWAVAAVFLGFAGAVLFKIFNAPLATLIEEPAPTGAPAGAQGKASLSRFQLLLFTFVIAGLYLVLSIEAGYFIEIPNGVLGLLGISGGSYVISKGIK